MSSRPAATTTCATASARYVPPEERRLLTTAQAAKIIGASSRSLSRWAAEGKVTPAAVLPGGALRWDMKDLRRQLAVRADDE